MSPAEPRAQDEAADASEVSDAGDTRDAGDASNARDGGDADDVQSVRRALRAVRRENLKAVALSTMVNVVLFALVVNLVVSWSWPTIPAVPDRAMLSVGTALVVGGLLAWWMLGRRSAVGRFERANPSLGVALRTARDAAADGDDGTMARVHYHETLDRLRDASGVALLPRRRLAVTLAFVFLVAVLTVQTTVAPISVGGVQIGPAGSPPQFGPGGGADGSGSGAPADEGGDGGTGDASAGGPGSAGAGRDDVLGEPADVTPGSVDVTAQVDVGSGPNGDGEVYERGGLDSSSDVAVAPQEAEFAPPEDLSDADIIRAYNLRIRDTEEDDDQ